VEHEKTNFAFLKTRFSNETVCGIFQEKKDENTIVEEDASSRGSTIFYLPAMLFGM
jgi:hypothetical protein